MPQVNVVKEELFKWIGKTFSKYRIYLFSSNEENEINTTMVIYRSSFR